MHDTTPTPLGHFALLLAALVFTHPATAAEVVVYHEDFEGPAPPWAASVAGLPAGNVHHVGVSDDRAASGSRSLKIEVTLMGNSALAVWRPLPFKIPLTARPRLTARVWTGQTNTILAVNLVAPQREFESVGRRDFRKGRGRFDRSWETLIVDAASDDFGEILYKGELPEDGYINGIGVYFDDTWLGADRRGTLYIDDVVVTADVAPGWEARFATRLEKYEPMRRRLAQEKARTRAALITRLKQTVAPRGRRLAARGPEPTLPADTAAGRLERRLLAWCAQRVAPAQQRVAELDQPATADAAIAWLQQHARDIELACDALTALQDYPRPWLPLPYWLGAHDPTRDDRILPGVFPSAAIPGRPLHLAACRGEYEPASLVVEAASDLSGMTVEVCDLSGDAGALPAGIIEIHWVKRWWQAGHRLSETNSPRLVPELLLKDCDLVSVSPDAESHRNTLRSPRVDAARLQPVDVAAGDNRQIWLTAHIPDDAPAGAYRGTLSLTFANAPAAQVPLVVQVHPFELSESRWDSSIYYVGRLKDPPHPYQCKFKTPARYEGDMLNMRAHGIRNPTSFAGFDLRDDGTHDFTRLQRELEIRRRTGMLAGPIPLLNVPRYFRRFLAADSDATREQILAEAAAGVHAARDFCREHGYPELMFYAVDEAGGRQLMAEAPVMRAIHEAGGKVAVACAPDYFSKVGRYLYCAIVESGRLSEIRRSQALGYRVWCYARPQGGQEVPEIFRRNYGLLIWRRGEDGAATYAYQSAMPEHSDMWDDFNCTNYRDHVMAYPTEDGLVDTVQWEGYREGVDDLRYLTTLLQHIEQAATAGHEALAASARQWLHEVDIENDLTTIRTQMVAWIVRLGDPSREQACRAGAARHDAPGSREARRPP